MAAAEVEGQVELVVLIEVELTAYQRGLNTASILTTIPPRSKATFRHCLPTLSRFTHATPHTIFSQSEHVEPSILPN